MIAAAIIAVDTVAALALSPALSRAPLNAAAVAAAPCP